MGLIETIARIFVGSMVGAFIWFAFLWACDKLPYDNRYVMVFEDYFYRLGVLYSFYLLSVSLFVTLALKI